MLWLLGTSAAPAWGGAPPPDTEAPVILVLPSDPTPANRDLVVRARIQDPSGVQTVTVWARGEHDAEFQGFPMEPAGAGGEFAGRVPAGSHRGARVAYFVEASDKLGNGPRRSGDPSSPFVARIDVAAPAAAPAEEEPVADGGTWSVGLAWIAGVLLLPVVGWGLRRRSVDPETAFWCKLLGPLSDKSGVELTKRIEVICQATLEHPLRGRIQLTREEVLLWLGTLRHAEPKRLQRMRSATRARGFTEISVRSARKDEHKRVAEDIFWMHLLAPVVDLPAAEEAAALRELANRPHAHPSDGIRTFDPRTLRDRLRWAREVNPRELIARWKAVHLEGPQPAASTAEVEQASDAGSAKAQHLRKSAGASLVELLVALLILGIGLGAAALALRPETAPVRTAGRLVEGLVKQARARAMATTSSQRVRPFTQNQLVVEYAPSCASAAWTLEPRMDLDLPDGVSLDATNWSICFNSRGTASSGVVLTLDHPEYRSQQLEILLGGAVRWLN